MEIEPEAMGPSLQASPRENREPVESANVVLSPLSPLGSPTGGTSRPRKNRRKDKETKNGFESVQDVIFESMRETQRMRRSRTQSGLETSVFFDTVKDITTVASGTIASIKEWTKQHTHEQGREARTPNGSSALPHSPVSQGEPDTSSIERFGAVAHSEAHRNNILQDLAWPFAVCGLNVHARLPEKNNLAPHIHKVKEVVSKAVNGEINNAATGIWKFAAGSKDEDDNTVGTLDTLQEENNQIRRLGSWGTVNTAGTGGTGDTGFNSFEPSQAPSEINLDIMEDDDGNTIDPVLLQKAQQTREKRSQRREKLVKFDYPPIKSLRQCPRPDPKDLPDLFFTEHELDQIEDDRYSTMSTDDIEIVAVSSKAEETQTDKARFKNYKSPKAKHTPHTTITESPPSQLSPSDGREQPETAWKQTRGRSATPYRRRHHEDDEEADFPTHQAKSPSNNGRLVKGVQIYLRERSTGA